MNDELETKQREKRVYGVVKREQREREETVNIDIIEDKEGKCYLMKISSSWADYFEQLLNVENTQEVILETYKVE